MKKWNELKNIYVKYEQTRKGIVFDNNIYTFDIESTNYYILNNIVYEGSTYNDLSEEEKEKAIPQTTMYIWTFNFYIISHTNV